MPPATLADLFLNGVTLFVESGESSLSMKVDLDVSEPFREQLTLRAQLSTPSGTIKEGFRERVPMGGSGRWLKHPLSPTWSQQTHAALLERLAGLLELDPAQDEWAREDALIHPDHWTAVFVAFMPPVYPGSFREWALEHQTEVALGQLGAVSQGEQTLTLEVREVISRAHSVSSMLSFRYRILMLEAAEYGERITDAKEQECYAGELPPESWELPAPDLTDPVTQCALARLKLHTNIRLAMAIGERCFMPYDFFWTSPLRLLTLRALRKPLKTRRPNRQPFTTTDDEIVFPSGWRIRQDTSNGWRLWLVKGRRSGVFLWLHNQTLCTTDGDAPTARALMSWLHDQAERWGVESPIQLPTVPWEDEQPPAMIPWSPELPRIIEPRGYQSFLRRVLDRRFECLLC